MLYYVPLIQISSEDSIMNKKLTLFLIAFLCTTYLQAAPPNDFVVPLSRMFSKDLFDANADNFLSPTVNVVNSTSNSAFFHSAYVPHKVDKPYFRLSLNGMLGFVTNDMKHFKPNIPTKEFNMTTAAQYVNIDVLNPTNSSIKDTAAFLNYILQNILYMGIQDGSIVVPESSATTLGNKGAQLRLDEYGNENIKRLIKQHPLYGVLAAVYPEGVAMLDNVAGTLPNVFTLPDGGDLSTIAAGVPQIEIGSFMGTELLVRYIPKINLGEWLGNFTFWGVGLKHSISQYFYDDVNRDGNATARQNIAPFDMALQVVYQNTSLDNTVGLAASKLVANAKIFDVNLEFSKNFNNWFELYTGVSYEKTSIEGTYTYYLPVELQWQLGLLKLNEDGNGYIVDPPEYPGDTEPQSSDVKVSSKQLKWTLGLAKNLGPVTLYVDYSISKFSILSGGLQYRF